VGIRLSGKQLVYSLVSVFDEIVPIPVPFFLFRSAASTSHGVISGTSVVSVWIMALCPQLGVEFLYLFFVLIFIMDFSILLVQECDQFVLS